MMFRLIHISENTVKLSDELKELNKTIPWYAIKGLRNRIVHNYGSVELDVVYDTIIHDIPELYNILSSLK